jgi:hypothetical protein
MTSLEETAVATSVPAPIVIILDENKRLLLESYLEAIRKAVEDPGERSAVMTVHHSGEIHLRLDDLGIVISTVLAA